MTIEKHDRDIPSAGPSTLKRWTMLARDFADAVRRVEAGELSPVDSAAFVGRICAREAAALGVENVPHGRQNVSEKAEDMADESAGDTPDLNLILPTCPSCGSASFRAYASRHDGALRYSVCKGCGQRVRIHVDSNST